MVSQNLVFYNTTNFLKKLLSILMFQSSVAEPELEPEPMEQQLFAGAGAKVVSTRLRSRV
jgi:hypothetical protein